MSGGVRNLRAMFENKEESTLPPPDRGRSPAGSIGGGSNGTSPRPLSKVRTSFVAVERSGQLGPQWGLRKESNTDPSLATRRASFSVNEVNDAEAIADKKQSIKSEISARKNSAAISEIIPEFAIGTPPIELEERLGYINGNSGLGKVSPAEPISSLSRNQKMSVEEHHRKPPPGDVKSRVSVSGRAATASNKSGGFDENMNSNGIGKPKPSSPTKALAGTALSSRTARPGPISTAPSLVTAKTSTKPTTSPSHPKTPTTPAKSSKGTTSKPAASSAAKAQPNSADMRVTKATAGPNINSKTAARPVASLMVASTSENKAPKSSPTTGFHKPKPRSPTRPAKLPASMTAPTASSLSKVTSVAPTSRQSLAPTDKTVSRSRSHASLAQKQDLHHKPSRPDNERPALGRPPTSTLKKQPSRPSLSKQTLPVEESFLARMMRPTTSSASKTTEKITTPPRAKTQTRPTTREGLPSHKLHHGLKGSPSSKKLPPAAKETFTEGPSAIRVAEAEDVPESAGFVDVSEPELIERTDVRVPIDVADETLPMSSCENEHIEKDLAQESTKDAPNFEEGTNEPLHTTQQVGLLSDPKDPKVEVETPHSSDESARVEKVAELEKDHNATVKASETTINSKEPLILEMQGIVEPAPDVTEDHPSINISEPRKEELEPVDTLTAE